MNLLKLNRRDAEAAKEGAGKLHRRGHEGREGPTRQACVFRWAHRSGLLVERAVLLQRGGLPVRDLIGNLGEEHVRRGI